MILNVSLSIPHVISRCVFPTARADLIIPRQLEGERIQLSNSLTVIQALPQTPRLG